MFRLFSSGGEYFVKNLFLLTIFFMSSGAFAREAYPGLNFQEVNKPVYCHPPSQPFFEKKLRESFHFSEGESELKEVVRDPRNYTVREEIKGLRRQMYFANRVQRSFLEDQLVPKIENMIEVTNRRNPIADFPINGTSSNLSSSEEGHLSIAMENLPKEELDFLPPQIVEKIGNKVKIKYHYPLDKFDYVISYNGKELPMDQAFHKMQDEFESVCLTNALNSRDARQKRENGFESNKPKTLGSGGGASAQ